MSLVLAVLGALRAALKTRTDLTLENLALRQQLALLPPIEATAIRTPRSPPLGVARKPVGWVARGAPPRSPRDRDRWHRQGFRAFWTWKYRRGRTGRPPVGSELVNLVRTMALANPLWGAPLIHGELLKLGM